MKEKKHNYEQNISTSNKKLEKRMFIFLLNIMETNHIRLKKYLWF